MIGKLQAEQIGDLALVPTQKGADGGDARDGAARDATPDEKGLPQRAARDVAKFEATGLGIPGIGHLHPTATLDQRVDRIREFLRFDRDEIETWRGGAFDNGHGTPGESDAAIDAK